MKTIYRVSSSKYYRSEPDFEYEEIGEDREKETAKVITQLAKYHYAHYVSIECRHTVRIHNDAIVPDDSDEGEIFLSEFTEIASLNRDEVEKHPVWLEIKGAAKAAEEASRIAAKAAEKTQRRKVYEEVKAELEAEGSI